MYYSKKDIKILIDKMDNAQDRFFILAIYNCIRGACYEDLSKLKVEDVNFDNGTINVKSRIIKMDKLFLETTKEALKQEVYYKKGDNANQKSYEINTSSEYVLRPKPCVQTEGGLTPYTNTGLKFKKINLEKYLGEKIEITDIYRSGLINILINLGIVDDIGKYKFDKLLKELELKGTYKDVMAELKEVLESKKYLEEYI